MNRWLDRRIACPGPYLTLCMDEAEYRKAMKHLGIKQYGQWLNDNCHATTHVCTNQRSQLACVVCLGDTASRTPVEVAGLLVHEAVHIWQQYIERIGERRPGDEQEAYAIQNISQELMAEFARRMEPK